MNTFVHRCRYPSCPYLTYGQSEYCAKHEQLVIQNNEDFFEISKIEDEIDEYDLDLFEIFEKNDQPTKNSHHQ
jgi:hypothetical protein